MVRMYRSKKTDGSYRQIYSFVRSVDGGPCKKDLMADLKGAGIKAESAHSIYQGQTAIAVVGNKKQHKEAESIIYG